MSVKQKIQKTRQYLDYIERHYDNVQNAWALIKEKCSDMWFAQGDSLNVLDRRVKAHDLSKLSASEFVQYRQKFFACSTDPQDDGFDYAWEHHKRHNEHHWQQWTTLDGDGTLNCVHMVVDWVAMSAEFGGSAKEYYESNKHAIPLPDWAEKLIYEIFSRLA